MPVRLILAGSSAQVLDGHETAEAAAALTVSATGGEQQPTGAGQGARLCPLRARRRRSRSRSRCRDGLLQPPSTACQKQVSACWLPEVPRRRSAVSSFRD
jgi:hypothetical protein